jgi:hypothetical protein
MSLVGTRSFPDTSVDQEIHGPFQAADVRLGEPIVARCLVRNSQDAAEHVLQVWRISPLGVELVLPRDGLELDVGSELDLSIRFGRQQSQFTGLVVSTRSQESDRELIGVRWSQPTTAATGLPTERRSTERWLCGQEFLPTGVAPNPARFNDFIHFRVRDISKDGMQIVTSLRNKFIVPGMVFESLVSVPTMGQLKLDLHVINARITSEQGKDYLSVGVRIANPTPQASQMLGQFVFQFGPPTTLEALRSSGFEVGSSTRAVDFAYVRTSDEYKSVLQLRQRAYQQYGGSALGETPEALSDIFDARARILMAKYRGEVVGSLRLIFNESTDRFEHEDHFTLPSEFPRKDEMVEISRVCTHPEYRGSDLLIGLFRHAAMAVLQSRRQFVLGYAPPKLVPLYARLGARWLPVEFKHPSDDVNLKVFLIDVRGGLSGADINPVVWNAIYGEMIDYLDTREILDGSSLTHMRLSIYRALSPLAHVLQRRVNRPRRRDKSKS